MAQILTHEIKQVVAKQNFDEKEKAIAYSLIALHSGIIEKDNIKVLCLDCDMLVSVHNRIQDDIDKIIGESKNSFYNEWKRLMSIPLTRLSKIIDLINILFKYPDINERERNSVQRAYGIIEEYNLKKMVFRIAKMINRCTPFEKIINDG